LDSLLAAAERPSGYEAHNSKKVFRLLPRRNIVFSFFVFFFYVVQ